MNSVPLRPGVLMSAGLIPGSRSETAAAYCSSVRRQMRVPVNSPVEHGLPVVGSTTSGTALLPGGLVAGFFPGPLPLPLDPHSGPSAIAPRQADNEPRQRSPAAMDQAMRGRLELLMFT